jgi:hypothetical protein
MKNTKSAIIMIALVMVIVGTTLAPIQSYAARSGGFPNTSTLKQAVRDGVTVNLEHRDQHMNQENLCYRTNTCRQSDVGQNTLGNDNSVTGFADQSDNIQQSAAAPITTPGNNTAPGNNTIPTPTPRTCEECFTSFLNATQITELLQVVSSVPEPSIAALCADLVSGQLRFTEDGFRLLLTGTVGVSVTTANELIACLKAHGITFA